MTGLIEMIFGWRNDREVKRLKPFVSQINEIESGLQKLSDDELRAKTAAWRGELAAIEDKDELAQRLNDILPEPCAVVKKACRRPTGQEITVRSLPQKWERIPFDVQIVAGIGLPRGKIAEMAAGVFLHDQPPRVRRKQCNCAPAGMCRGQAGVSQ
jgi:preprotein translocase subunit SecA